MHKKKKTIIWLVSIVAAAALLAVFMLAPFCAQLRSMAIMSVFSRAHETIGVAEQQQLRIKIPSGEGWYPFVMTYNDDEDFALLTKQKGSRLTIMYNFPAFDVKYGCSRLFDEESPYYNSFYGAYLTKLPDGSSYGFDPEGIELTEAVSSIARLDYFWLVLSDFGLERDDRVFSFDTQLQEENVFFAGSEGWVRIDAQMFISGAAHNAKPGVRSYLQYGRPGFPVSQELAPVKMYSTVFSKYFESHGTTVYFYVMASDETVRDSCIADILSKAMIAEK